MASWDLLRDLDNLRREIDEAFRGVGFIRPLASTFLAPTSARRFPLINFSEDASHVYVDALVPGVEPKDLELTALRNTLTIHGTRKPFAEQPGQILHRIELGSGTFTRTLELPVEIDPERINAECKDGIVRITLAKAAHARPKKIEIKLA